MGNSNSSIEVNELELEKDVKSSLYPWRDLIKFVYDKAGNPKKAITDDLVATILQSIDPNVREITEGSNRDVMDKLGIEGNFQPPIDWCVALLAANEKLAKARYNVVPRFVDEEGFWCRYFNQIIYLIRDELEKHGIRIDEELIG